MEQFQIFINYEIVYIVYCQTLHKIGFEVRHKSKSMIFRDKNVNWLFLIFFAHSK